MITVDHLKEILDYNPDTGLLTWKVTLGTRQKVGMIVGERSIKYKSYIRVTIYGKTYKAHRLIWFYVHGAFPVNQIDHINQNRKDNRLSNLREVSNLENSRNHTKNCNNKSGICGVHWDKQRDKWMAYIKVEYKRIHLGRFTEFEDAVKARKLAEIEYGFHENHGSDKTSLLE